MSTATRAAALQVSTLRKGQTKVQLSAHEPDQMCKRCLDLFLDTHPESPATEVVMKVVGQVVCRVAERLVKKVVNTCTSLRTTQLTRTFTTLKLTSP